MAEYRGLAAIAARLGYSGKASVGRLIRRDGLPAMRRTLGGISDPRTPAQRGTWNNRPVWWIDDNLITLWLLQRAELDRERIISLGLYINHNQTPRSRRVKPDTREAVKRETPGNQVETPDREPSRD